MLATDSGYEILEKIASGGMATVHLGRRRGPGGFSRLVAVKMPHDWVCEDPLMMKALQREAFVASRLHHANVVAVLDVTLIGNRAAIVMEYVDGVAASSLFTPYEKRFELDVGASLRVLMDCCAGIQAAHDYADEGKPTPIVHRDISPQNILVGRDGVARVTDFGIAKFSASGTETTRSGVIKGKLSYLAPEYLSGAEPSAASDQFSLAVLAWELLTGERLFKGSNEGETLKLLMHGPVKPASRVRPELYRFDKVLQRALSRRRAERYESVREFGQHLAEVAQDLLKTHGQVAELVADRAFRPVDRIQPTAPIEAAGSFQESVNSSAAPRAHELLKTLPISPVPACETNGASAPVDVLPGASRAEPVATTNLPTGPTAIQPARRQRTLPWLLAIVSLALLLFWVAFGGGAADFSEDSATAAGPQSAQVGAIGLLSAPSSTARAAGAAEAPPPRNSAEDDAGNERPSSKTSPSPLPTRKAAPVRPRAPVAKPADRAPPNPYEN